MAGYTRNDTSNNIATGNVINAADLDGEFDALVAAFHASTGHTHDGTAANGAPITKIGPAQDLVISTGAITPKTDNTVDLGSSSFEFKDLYIDGTANIDALVADTADINAGTIDGVTLGTNSAVTEAQIDNININGNTISSTDTNGNISLVPNGTGDVILTADTIQVGDSNTDVTVTTNGTGDLIFNTNAGTNSGVIRIYDGANGNIALTPNGTGEVDISKVDIDSGAIDGTAIGANSASTGAFTTLSASSTVTLSGGTADGVLYLNGSKVATSGSALTFDGTQLGIGISPSYPLHVVRDPSSGAIAAFRGTSTAANSRVIIAGNSSGDLVAAADTSGNGFIYSDTGKSLIFGQNGGTEGMRLDSTGLGIGTSSPTTKLTVAGVGRFLSGTEGTQIGHNGTIGYIETSGNSATPITFYIGGTERMRLDSSGNLGIGTSSPAVKLDVSGTGQSLFKLTTTNSEANINFNISGSTGNFFGITGGANFFWNTGSTERMRLDSSGNLGLGVTPSAWGTVTPVFQVNRASFYGYSNEARMSANYYYNAGAKYIASDYATSYSQSNGAHQWSTAPSGTAGNAITFTEAMTLDASGDLAIGTTTAPGARVRIKASNTTGSALYNYLNCTNEVDSDFQIRVTGSASTDKRAAIGTTTNTPLAFITNDTERARITSGGDLLVGTTSATNSPTTGVQLVNGGAGGGVFIGHPNGVASGNYYATFAYNSGIVGSITQDGTTAVLFNTTSDQRLKENICDAEDAATLIDSIKVRQYDWKSDGSHQRYGFVAQELLTVAPEAVHQPADPDEMMAVDYSKLVPMLVKEIQSLRQRVALLEGN